MRLSCAIEARTLRKLARYGKTHSLMTRLGMPRPQTSRKRPSSGSLLVACEANLAVARSWLDTMDIEAGYR